MNDSKYEAHLHGPLQGVVIGENNTVTIIFQDGKQLTVPFLAPPRPPYKLVGRDELLRDLKQRLLEGESLALSALNGLPGVGKTALAVELAHDREVLGHFSDGVLWARLGRKGDVLRQLGTWGAALGIPPNEIARLTSVQDRAEAIHAAIGMLRMLLVVDDAWQVQASLAFKLGGPNCAHLVTTRLPEVAVRFAGEGATVVHELTEDDGLNLLARLAPQVVEAGPDQARGLVRDVGGLPLALILMGAFLRVQAQSAQPGRLGTALHGLRQTEERLRLAQRQSPLERHPSLPLGAPLSLLASIGISDAALNEEARYALRALSILPPKPNSFSETAALAVSAAPAETLDTLFDHGLLESSGPNRYALHQTIADYGRLDLRDKTVYERIVEFFVHHVEAHKTDCGGLDLEYDNILAALQIAFERGMLAALVQGANAFYHLLDTRGLYAVAEIHLNRACQAAKSSGDAVGLVTTLLNLGRVERNRGHYEQAEEYLLEGLALAHEIGHHESTMDLLQNIGIVTANRGDYVRAERCYKEGLALAREMGDRDRISALFANLGTAALNQGALEQAEEYYQDGLTLAREAGDRDRIGALLMGLGAVADSRGDYQQAEDFYQEGLALARETGHRERITVLLSNLGGLATIRADYAQAELYLLEGLGLARKAGHRENVSLLLSNLGELATKRGNHQQAEQFYREGLALAREMGHRKRTSILLANLGSLVGNRGQYAQGEEYLLQGLSLAREMGQRWFISSMLNEWGELQLRQQKLESAFTAFHEALEMAREAESQESVADALYGLARVAAAQGNTAQARRQGQESLTIFEDLGHHRTAEAAQWVAALPAADPLE